ncbi:MAG: phosphotransferase [Burkholderiaceae bacterium]|nr:phosphotransferase [Burkholderiaceae bacterium]
MAVAVGGLPLVALQRWLETRLDGLDGLGGKLTADKVDGGQSNPTWILKYADRQWVLRAKPAPVADLMPSAHAIEREYQVLAALQNSHVSVPRVRVLCEDESVIGVAFYVMDFVEGRVLRDITLQDMPFKERKSFFWAMNDTLVALHQTDWRAAGLQDFGRHDGYFSRLIRRWGQQYHASISTTTEPMERLLVWLPKNIPTGADGSQDTCISHGDFRMENLIFHPAAPKVVAVLDWELSTLGHPLGDLAYNCLAWHLPSGILRGFADLNTQALGLPSQRDYVRRYCSSTGRDFSALEREWPFYLAFNLFRLSAILQCIAHRHQQGMAASASAEEIGRMALPVAQRGWAIASGTIPAFEN